METKPLLRALKLAAPSLLSTDFIEVNTHFCFLDTQVYAYDNRTVIFVDHETGLDCGVRGKVLLDVLETTTEDEVEITHKDAELLIKHGNSKVKLPVMDSDSFTFKSMELLEAKGIKVVLTEQMIDALELCLLGANQDAFKPELTGVTVYVKEGEHIAFYSTDDDSITAYKCSTKKKVGRGASEEGSGKEVTVIIPKQSADMIVKTYRAMDQEKLDSCTLVINSKMPRVEFESDLNVRIGIHPVAADPEDWAATVKKNLGKVEYQDVPGPLAAALQRAVLLQGKELKKRCAMSASGKNLRVWTAGMYGELDTKLKLADEVDADHFEFPPESMLRIMERAEKVAFAANMTAFQALGGNLVYLVSHYGDTKLEG